MKKSILGIMISAFALISLSSSAQFSYEKEWEKVEAFVKQGLPQSALQLVEVIGQQSVQDKQNDQYIKSLIYKIKLQSDYQEDFLLNAIHDIDSVIHQAAFPEKSILESILAELLYRYYQQNRHLIAGRTVLDEPDMENMEAWDLRSFVEAASKHYLKSVEKPESLAAISISDYSILLEGDESSRIYRPTLYDFLAYRALLFFTADEPGISRPAERFEINNPGFFGSATHFIDLDMPPHDRLTFNYQALHLYRELLKIHSTDTDKTALADADLKRLEFVYHNAVMVDKDSLYMQALEQASATYSDTPVLSDIYLSVAGWMFQQGQAYNPFFQTDKQWKLKEAVHWCGLAIEAYPESEAALKALILKDQILQAGLNITTRDVEVPNREFLVRVDYKNTGRLYFRIVPLDPMKEMESRNRNEERLQRYLSVQAVQSWDQSLRDEGDHQMHSTELLVPALQPGYYALIVSTSPDFSSNNQIVSYKTLWVSNISYVIEKKSDGFADVFVLDRSTGLPLSNVKVQNYIRKYDYQIREYTSTLSGEYFSDKEGFVNILGSDQGRHEHFLVFSTGKEQYINEEYFSNYNDPRDQKMRTTTHFFTDRSVYRPGQTIYFKGIVIGSEGNKYSVLSNHSTTVIFYDVNHQRIDELELETNEFGSISGSFVSPPGVLTGSMSIQNNSGSVSFSVEEYKLPKFEVLFNPVEGSYKLGETVSVRATAKAYAGNPIDGASVSYRIVRNARFPVPYRNWFRPWPESSPVEIVQGESMTDSQGNITIQFKALPDAALSSSLNPVFNYTVYLDVTDINGETHTAETSVGVGYNALILDVDVPDQLNKSTASDFGITASNLNGQKLNTQVGILIHKLDEPDTYLLDRPWPRTDVLSIPQQEYKKLFPHNIYSDEDDVSLYPEGKKMMDAGYNTRTDSIMSLENLSAWNEGWYKISLSGVDEFGTAVKVDKYFILYDLESRKTPYTTPHWLLVEKGKAEPGETASILIGTSIKKVRLLYELQQKGNVLHREWIDLNNEQQLIEIPVLESYRGNISVNLLYVHDNRIYLDQETIEVPFTNKELDISIETFRDKLLPGEKEEWRLTIKGSKGEILAAELLAGMYDAALDQIRPHNWYFKLFHPNFSEIEWSGTAGFMAYSGTSIKHFDLPGKRPKERIYEQLNWFGFNTYSNNMRYSRMDGGMMLQAAPNKAMEIEEEEKSDVDEIPITEQDNQEPETTAGFAPPPIRQNFKETAFFYPQLKTNDKGEVVFSFTMPESLTRWNFMGLAHTPDLEIGHIRKDLVTSKDLMIVPNPPRFFREGDKMEFSAKVVSLDVGTLSGNASLELFNALTMEVLDMTLSDQAFSVDQGKSARVSWSIEIPEGVGVIIYRVKARAGNFTDGEERAIPVLPNRMMVTESLPLPMNGKGTKEFTFEKLIQSKKSKTISNHRLTLEFSSNPIWYAVQAMPYMMEFPQECSEQLFSRFYANSLAQYMANSDPKIKQVFDSWKSIAPEALQSNLEKNQELKAVLIEETPWVRDAQSESEQKQRLGLLFDLNHMQYEMQKTFSKLNEQQLASGAWPWFKGMRENRYITQYIVTGMGRLHHMGVIDLKKDNRLIGMVRKAMQYLDNQILEEYQKLIEKYPDGMDQQHISRQQIQYLYARSYYGDLLPVKDKYTEAVAYFYGQATEYTLEFNKYIQGMIALISYRAGDEKTAEAIVRSLKEHALYSDEMGMYWREPAGYYWYQAPVEFQALMIEVFDEVTDDSGSVDLMQMWLLKQKQTQHWKTTRATADAIYALLIRGSEALSTEQDVSVTMGHEKVDPLNMEGLFSEPGTGYFKTSWSGNEIDADMGRVKVEKKEDGLAWGAVYWQYFEDLDKITAAETPLSLERELFIEKNTDNGPVLVALEDGKGIDVGDKIKVRVIVRVDRAMDYVHLKDMRASAFEPLEAISGYRYQAGIGYYQAIRDASMNFFFDHLFKGTYVLEYDLVATQIGEFSNGISTIQCMYAPEFSAHSEGIRVIIK